MVKVSIRKNESGQIIACKVTGHAESAPKGKDLVCAAVSTLTQTALLGLVQYAGVKLKYKVQEGLLTFELKEEPNEKTNAILETMSLGLAEIAKNYKNNLELEQYGGKSHV
jgi:uncharacterized protein YsxB (DUF464 family)